MKLLPIIFLAVFCFYFFLFRNRVWFHHDDFDFLVGSANFNFSYLVTPHNEHFLPIFRILYYLEYSLFGLNFTPFFIISILLHLFILFVLYKITVLLTRKKIFAYIAIILFAINSTFFEVILWSSEQQLLLSALFITLSFLFWLRYRRSQIMYQLIISAICAILGAFSFGVGLFYPIFLSVVSLFDKKISKAGKWFYVFTALITISTFLLFAGQNLNIVTKQSFSIKIVPKILYFSFVGIMEGTLSRFFYAPFLPSRNANSDLILMPILNVAILFFLVILFFKSKTKNRENYFIKIILGLHVLLPYIVISLTRYPAGAKGAMAERYVYLTLFFFILFLIYQVNQLKSTSCLKTTIALFCLWTVFSQGVFFYIRSLKWTEQPQKSKTYMLSLQRQMKLGLIKSDCNIPFYIKARVEPCYKYLPILR